MASDLEAKRIQHLYELLDTYHDKLALVEQDQAVLAHARLSVATHNCRVSLASIGCAAVTGELG
ncbi:MAG: hypothetical protein KAY37_15975 [Phycisphaerae bacterium]|nr:hypothetical protein [Phycisphaerae bacterium]